MRVNLNQEVIEGRVYDQNLAIKTVQNQQSENYGKEFISGTVDVATDEAGLNVLTVHYTYITEVTRNGKEDSRFKALKRIMDEGLTWLNVGKDGAMKVKLTPQAALNDFYPQGGDELVSQPRNEGGFINIVSNLNEKEEARHTFKFDAIITGATLVEGGEEDEDYVKINAAIFNFRNAILPFPMVAKDSIGPGSVDYFMNLGATPSAPVFTQVWGIINNTTVKVERVIESAFGTPSVDVSNRSRKEWVVTGAKPEPYMFGDEDVMTTEDLTKAIADRNVYLEEVKSRAKEYYESRGNAISAPKAPAPAPQISTGNFNF